MSSWVNPAGKPHPTRPRLFLLISISLFFAFLGFVIFSRYVEVRMEEEKRQSRDKLKLIGSALKEYLEKNKKLPPGIVYDKNGTPLYSWRVLLLPYLGEEGLYRQFKLNEAWDSPHNLELLPKIPAVYAPPASGMTKVSFSTFYQVFDGHYERYGRNEPEKLMKLLNTSDLGTTYYGERRTAFISDKRFGLHPFSPMGSKVTVFEGGPDGPGESLTLARIRFVFGTSNFISVVEGGEAVPWTKPADLTYDPEEPLPKLGGLFLRGFHALDLDGRIHFVCLPILEEEKIRSQIAKLGSEGEGDW
jgi:hypothetical protein